MLSTIPDQQSSPTEQPKTFPAPQPIQSVPSGLSPRPKRSRKRRILLALALILIAIIGSGVGALIWYNQQLRPVEATDTGLVSVDIPVGTTPLQIGIILHEKSLIRNKLAFDIYTRVHGVRNTLQAATYRLSPSQSLSEIVEHLTKGSIDEFSITFLPGATLAQHRKSLIKAGFSEAEVDAGFAATYTGLLFAGRPAGADLEGYIYGETYNFTAGATVQEILQRSFDQFQDVIVDNNLEAGFKQQGLTLYQGITMASIVQREVNAPVSPDPSTDQKQVAQVFYKRYNMGISLGSDVTYQYIADKLGQERDVNFDSPYNTRRYAGLPPGPIASPGLTALKATAAPASTDYLFFLSGDDNITYFARTDAEHQANIVTHCVVKCSVI